MIVYKITNKTNGKIYIGKTIQKIAKRWYQHVIKSRQSDSKYLLHLAIAKYGEENFLVEVIDTASSNDELMQLECHYIKVYDTYNNPEIGYNMTPGGDTGLIDDIAKQRKALAMQSIEYRDRVSKQFTGYKWSAETLAKRSNSLRGKTRTPEQRERMRQAALGRKLSPEHREKIGRSVAAFRALHK